MGAELRGVGAGVYDRWTALWNGELRLAAEIMAPEFTLRYAQAGTEVFDEVRTPERLAEVIAQWRAMRGPGLRFEAEGVAVADLEPAGGTVSGLVARPYRASFVDADGAVVARSGTDTLRITDGLITEVWSVSSGAAGRTFYPG
ncbi:nuclear transport factor 2 family protein [Kitasatospora sp. NPDC004745]|uniref:nuclear transport factor 2 family protein n=1 Tax=Kitasatospora sp. NPDC004745 TaxID=3364019 RepID=UPI0036BCEC73